MWTFWPSLYKFGIPSEFPEEVLAQAENIPLEIPAEALEGRRDLRSEQIVTIDGADAKDLDDAISLKTTGKWQLSVGCAHRGCFLLCDGEFSNRSRSL